MRGNSARISCVLYPVFCIRANIKPDSLPDGDHHHHDHRSWQGFLCNFPTRILAPFAPPWHANPTSCHAFFNTLRGNTIS